MATATIKFETSDGGQSYRGLSPNTAFRIVKRSVGRGRYAYHGYRNDAYIAYGTTFERAVEQITLWIRRQS